MAKVEWKSGSRVKLPSGDKTLYVVGYDCAGSVICRSSDDERSGDLYVTPSLLVSADGKSVPED
jgi:hypothetical protein